MYKLCRNPEVTIQSIMGEGVEYNRSQKQALQISLKIPANPEINRFYKWNLLSIYISSDKKHIRSSKKKKTPKNNIIPMCFKCIMMWTHRIHGIIKQLHPCIFPKTFINLAQCLLLWFLSIMNPDIKQLCSVTVRKGSTKFLLDHSKLSVCSSIQI